MEYNVNPQEWFGDRLIDHVPIHFTVCKTPCTDESKKWIYTNLHGRFSFVEAIDPENQNEMELPILLSLFTNGIPAFEDPDEALMYELTWS
jgi:hypothetical protein